MSAKYHPDIIWIVIDGIRLDKLRSCGNLNRPSLFIDEVLAKGTLFTKVIVGNCCSRGSMHVAFTSLYSPINKMDAYDPLFQMNFDPLVVSLTDLLRHTGYKTFRYIDTVDWRWLVDSFQIVPTSGFNVWESGGYRHIWETPQHSFSTNRRDTFIAKFNQTSSPKFAFMHLMTSHEINNEMAVNFTWTSEMYKRNLREISKDFEDVWNKLQITDETLVIVSTDHGIVLDQNYVEEERRYGIRLQDINTKTFCSFIKSSSIRRQVINRMVRSIDIAPTILEIADCEPLLGQGISLVPLIKGEKFPEIYAFMETGGIYDIPASTDKPNVWGVRTEKWKYWKHAWRGEWLIDLENDPKEEINLIKEGLPIEDKLRKLVKEELIDTTKSAEQIYAENARTRGISKYLTKRKIMPEVSLFLLVQKPSPHLAEAIDSILAQICVYFELVIVDATPEGSAKAIVGRYHDYRLSYRQYLSDIPFISIFNDARGKYISFISPEITYAPYFLYDLRKNLEEKPTFALVYANYQQIDQMGLEKVVNANKEFNKKNNIGYCFLARKEVVGNPPDSEVAIFNGDNLYLPLVKGISIFPSPQILGYRYYRAGIYTLGLHILHKVIELERKEGRRVVVKKGMKFLRHQLDAFH